MNKDRDKPLPIPPEVPHAAKCRHGELICGTCGNPDRRPVMHRTQNGDGIVGALVKKKGKRR